MDLYHFTTLKHAISNIERKRLKIARLNDMNDPFELLAQDISDPKWKQRILNVRDVADKILGFLCFSRDWRSPLMWSHYADRHRGACLSFEVNDKICQPIHYSRKRPRAIQRSIESGRDPVPEEIIGWLNTKFSDWNYEREIRLVCPLLEAINDGNLYFVKFSEDLILRKIILGAVCCPHEANKIRRTVTANSSGVTVLQAKLAEKTFDVVTF